MKRLIPFSILATSLLVMTSLVITTISAQEVTPTVMPEPSITQPGERESIALTLYNTGTALVQDRRSYTIGGGETTVDFNDVAATIDPTSVQFRSLTDPTGTTVLEQNFLFDLVDSFALLNRYVDQRIELTLTDGTVYAGQLLSGRNGEIILRTDAGQIAVIMMVNVRDLRFPELPGGLLTRPTLRWTLNSPLTGVQSVEVTYLAGGMNWTADYTVLLATDNTALDLNGWITLTNTSGTTFSNAQVKLVAGDVNRIQPEGVSDMMLESDMRGLAAAPMAVEERAFSEYRLYEIARRVTVANNETKQVEFVTGADIPAETIFVYNASQPYYGYPIYDQYTGATGITNVQNYLQFSTAEEGGLGAALPAGRIRVYQEDIDGAALLIGENTIDHTPRGEPVRILLGNAFDLVGERTQTAFNAIAVNVIEETYEIRLRNRKEDHAVTIRVPEHLFRWTNWEILNASAEYTQTDSSTIEFVVEVPPGGEEVITYTVRYSFPN